MTTLTDFLEARLVEDEAVARAVQDNSAPFNGQWYNDEGRALRTANDWVLAYEHHGKTFVPGLLDHLARHDPARVLREVQAKRAIIAHESNIELPEWQPDCGGDWVLSGPWFFANYWPDNTVTASIGEDDGPRLAESGIVAKESRAACQVFAENWIREHLPERSAALRDLAAVYSDHESYRPEWRP